MGLSEWKQMHTHGVDMITSGRTKWRKVNLNIVGMDEETTERMKLHKARLQIKL
jgi:hypothetical protein